MDKIKCLYCETEFEPKRETAKFCKDSCRVLWHRKNGANKAVSKTQIQVLYNAVLDAVSKINYQPNTAASFVGKQNVQYGDPLNLSAPKKALKSFEYYRMAKKELELAEDWEKMKIEILEAENLTDKQKNVLLTTNI